MALGRTFHNDDAGKSRTVKITILYLLSGGHPLSEAQLSCLPESWPVIISHYTRSAVPNYESDRVYVLRSLADTYAGQLDEALTHSETTWQLVLYREESLPPEAADILAARPDSAPSGLLKSGPDNPSRPRLFRYPYDNVEDAIDIPSARIDHHITELSTPEHLEHLTRLADSDAAYLLNPQPSGFVTRAALCPDSPPDVPTPDATAHILECRPLNPEVPAEAERIYYRLLAKRLMQLKNPPETPVKILGLNAYHGDSSASLLVNGIPECAVEEERLTRLKHWAGFPERAGRLCLATAGTSLDQLQAVTLNRNPHARIGHKLRHTLRHRPAITQILRRFKNATRVSDIAADLTKLKSADSDTLPVVHHVEHHLAHLASAFYLSPFDSATCVSVDGFGDFASAMWGGGFMRELQPTAEVRFPHSLGLAYLAITQYLGFPNYGDEYKVMGLAPYGKPEHLNTMRDMIRLTPAGFELNLRYFVHHKGRMNMTWDGGSPTLSNAFSPYLEKMLGPARSPEQTLEQHHKDIAASLQAMYEEAFLHVLSLAHHAFPSDRLCLAGGCAMNSVANGLITENTSFREIYVHPAAGDAGGALGSALYLHHAIYGQPREFTLPHASLGPSFEQEVCEQALANAGLDDQTPGYSIARYNETGPMLDHVVRALTTGGVVGWFQGGMEWGPRALGHRSILADPRRDDMRELLNRKIKLREPFRPFAPSVLREAVPEWFETDGDAPFMMRVFRIRQEKQTKIPAVTHVNGTGRLQTVCPNANPLYYNLISRFAEATGIPMVLNTSFNENEPIVCSPSEALDCFLRTRMDLLALGNIVIERTSVSGESEIGQPSGEKTLDP